MDLTYSQHMVLSSPIPDEPVLQNKLGGGEGIEGLYGTLACSGMQKVLECMSAKCGMTCDSRLVDMGAGIGRYASHLQATFLVK